MGNGKNLWLVVNSASGSNSDASVSQLRSQIEDAGLAIARTVNFPDDDLPTAAALDGAGIDLVVVFTGDGTINALVTGLYGWGGAILVLPGGTMNLLSRRLHGPSDSGEIIACVARGGARRVRPKVARCTAGDALAGLLAGPGTCWSDVREAMRAADVVGMVQGAAEAFSHTLDGPLVRLIDPQLADGDDYPLLEVTPTELGLAARGFHARTAGDMVSQSIALMRRQFREGPNDRLGLFEQMTAESLEDGKIAILVDGEPCEVDSPAVFTLADCGVDLLAIGRDA